MSLSNGDNIQESVDGLVIRDENHLQISEHTIKRVCCIGAGYVGGPTMAVIASKCPHIDVYVVDSSKERVREWNSSKIPIYEPGLDELISERRGKNLFFSDNVGGQIELADIIFISVNTPTKNYGLGRGRAADMTNLENVARLIAKHSKADKIVVEKSTVPVKAAECIMGILQANGSQNIKFDVLSNPEFMAEGTAIEDLLFPDRILIGGNMESSSGKAAITALKNIYLNWVDESKIILTNCWSSELSKLVANAFLAQRLSSINSIATICEYTGADIDEVAKAVGADSRIGSSYLKASIGFGGSCFRKDVLNLVYLCECLNLHEIAAYWYQVIEMNSYHCKRTSSRIITCLHNTVSQKHIAILGFSFKANTGDTRESPAKYICRELLQDAAILKIYDPKVSPKDIERELATDSIPWQDRLIMADDPYEAARSSHALVICTDWQEFNELDFEKIYTIMKKPALVFDGRRMTDRAKLKAIGFNVETIGTASKPKRFHWMI